MALNPSPVTISNIFNKKYEVDFYQRDYKWNDNKQTYKPIKSLLDDIFYKFDLSYQKDIDVSKEAISKYEWYYLNSFMVNSVDGKTFIVDGQQRLTTLTLLIINLIHLATKLNIDEGSKGFLKTKVCGYSSTGEKEFWLGFDDRKKALELTFENGLEGESRHIGDITFSEKNVYAAYKVINDYICKKINDAHIFKAFQLYLFERVVLVSIDVDEAKDVAMAFEVINDRGIPLAAYEILKGKILGLLDKSEVDDYVNGWNDSLKKLQKADEEKESNFDIFFSTYFRSKYADSLLQYRDLETDRYHKAIYTENLNSKIGFKHNHDKSKYISKIKKYVKEELPFFSELFSRILKDEKFSSSKNEYILFNSLNEQTGHFYLLLSAINLNDTNLEEKYNLIAKLFDRNYCLLNLTGSYRSNTFNESIIQLGVKIREKNMNEIKDSFDNHLLNEIKASHNRDDLRELFSYEFFSKIGYNDLPKRFLRYFFARLDNFIAKETNIPTADYYQMVKQASGKNKHDIEHILSNRQENQDKFSSEEDFNINRNRLGGLVILKSGINRSSNDELFDEKLKTYTSNGTILARAMTTDFYKSNPDFRKFCTKHNLDFKAFNNFGLNEIEERQNLIYQLSKIIWDV